MKKMLKNKNNLHYKQIEGQNSQYSTNNNPHKNSEFSEKFKFTSNGLTSLAFSERSHANL